MDKQFIIDEIRRTAIDGKPLGVDQFCSTTGFKVHELVGRHWAKWSDAQTEAGFDPLTFIAKFEDGYILEHIAALTSKLGRVPTRPEMQLERRDNPNFPN